MTYDSPEIKGVMKKELSVPLFICVLLAVLVFFVSQTVQVVLVFIPGILLSYIFYYATVFKKVPNPDLLLPLYLLALGVQFLHFTEEYLYEFNEVMAGLIGHQPYPKSDWLVFNMGAYFIFILGGIVIYRKIRELYIIPLLFILLGVVFNGTAHVVTTVYTKTYFPGFYTALAYLILGPILLKVIWRETRVQS